METSHIRAMGKTTMAYMLMLTQAQTVIAYRLMGMAGFLHASPGENARMVNEKGPAFTKANVAAFMAMMRGESPEHVADAWLKPIGARTKANAKRLSRGR